MINIILVLFICLSVCLFIRHFSEEKKKKPPKSKRCAMSQHVALTCQTNMFYTLRKLIFYLTKNFLNILFFSGTPLIIHPLTSSSSWKVIFLIWVISLWCGLADELENERIIQKILGVYILMETNFFPCIFRWWLVNVLCNIILLSC